MRFLKSDKKAKEFFLKEGSLKYELTSESIKVKGRTLYRIRALKTFPLRSYGSIKAGELGGYVQSEANLSSPSHCSPYYFY